MGVTSLAAQPVCLGPVKRASCADFVLKSRTTLYRHFLQQIFEKRANLSCCKTGLNVASKTRNVAIQLVLRQCCKTRSCTFLLPVSPHQRQFLYVQEFLILSSSPQKPKRPFSIAPLRLDLYCCSPFLLPEEIKNTFAQTSFKKSQSLQNRLEHIPDQLDFPKGRRQPTRINHQLNIWQKRTGKKQRSIAFVDTVLLNPSPLVATLAFNKKSHPVTSCNYHSTTAVIVIVQ